MFCIRSSTCYAFTRYEREKGDVMDLFDERVVLFESDEGWLGGEANERGSVDPMVL